MSYYGWISVRLFSFYLFFFFLDVTEDSILYTMTVMPTLLFNKVKQKKNNNQTN